MKYAKSVSFDKKSLDIIEQYQKDNGIWIFSKAVNQIIIQSKKGEKNDKK